MICKCCGNNNCQIYISKLCLKGEGWFKKNDVNSDGNPFPVPSLLFSFKPNGTLGIILQMVKFIKLKSIKNPSKNECKNIIKCKHIFCVFGITNNNIV